MKKTVFFLAFIISFSCFSQNITRVEVSGKIIVEGNDISGITIFNSSSNKGTISDDKGEFKLQVALNDIIEVSALQYQNLKFQINDAIIKSKKLKLFLIEEINQLDEIIVFNNELTGNLNTDIETTQPFKPKLDALYFGVKHSSEYDFEQDYRSEVQNMAVNDQKPTMVNGLNIINVVDQLLLPLFRSEVKDKKKVGVPEVPAEAIKYYFGSEFLVDNFNIPEHRVGEFIRYVESKDFDYDLLNYGNEMEFLELLNTKSKAFLNSKK